MSENIPHHQLHMFQGQLLQNLDPDEVVAAFLPVLPVQRKVKEVMGEVAVVGRAVLHLETTVGTTDKPGKDTAPASAGHAVPLLANDLDLLKHIVLNDVLMGIGETGLSLKRIVQLLLVPDRISGRS